MPKDNVIELKKPERFVDDPITEVLRTGARKLLAEALEVEIEQPPIQLAMGSCGDYLAH